MRKLALFAILIVATSFISMVQTRNSMNAKTEYIEIAKFKLKDGCTDRQFLDAEIAVRGGMIKSQKGFVSREISKDADGNWLMDMRFETKEEMDAWMVLLKQDPTMKMLGSMIDFGSMSMEFFTKQL